MMIDMTRRSELKELARQLAPFAACAHSQSIPWLLLGAQARNLTMELAGLEPQPRATEDVDVATEVASWEQYEQLRRALEEGAGAIPDGRVPHRLYLEGNIQIDIVPFGRVETHGQIEWPPNGDGVMFVASLNSAYRTALEVRLPGDLHVLVPDLASFVALKLIAWEGRKHDDLSQDAADLAMILGQLGELERLETLYSDHADLMEEHGYDPVEVCAVLLGRRLRSTLGALAVERIGEILMHEIDTEGPLELVRRMRLGPAGLQVLTALALGFESI